MISTWRIGLAALLLIGAQPCPKASAQDDLPDIASQELRADGDEQKRYFLVGPRDVTKVPRRGFGLLVVLPGGDGSAEFHPFIKRVYKNAMPPGYLVAQLVAVKWADAQEVIWPTKKNPVEGMKFSTEDFVDAVIKDAGARQHLDPHRVFTLAWSSGGPAAYAISLSSTKVTGSFIAMSIFEPATLPLEKAKGHGYFLYHSPDDSVCPFRMAKQAAGNLEKNGATVKLATYEGGHGWNGDVYQDVAEGLRWLEKNHAAAVKPKLNR